MYKGFRRACHIFCSFKNDLYQIHFDLLSCFYRDNFNITWSSTPKIIIESFFLQYHSTKNYLCLKYCPYTDVNTIIHTKPNQKPSTTIIILQWRPYWYHRLLRSLLSLYSHHHQHPNIVNAHNCKYKNLNNNNGKRSINSIITTVK